MPTFTEKYTARNTDYNEKYLRGTTSAFGFAVFGKSVFGEPKIVYSAKYSDRGTSHSDKYSDKSTAYTGKFTDKGTVYTSKY